MTDWDRDGRSLVHAESSNIEPESTSENSERSRIVLEGKDSKTLKYVIVVISD